MLGKYPKILILQLCNVFQNNSSHEYVFVHFQRDLLKKQGCEIVNRLASIVSSISGFL